MNLVRSALVVLGLAASQAEAPAPSPADGPSADPTAFHAVFLKLGPTWDRSLSVREQPGIRDHGRYMESLSAAGILVFGGPFLEEAAPTKASGAMVFLATADPAEARRLMEADPGLKAGLFEIGEVRRFMVGAGSWRPWKRP